MTDTRDTQIKRLIMRSMRRGIKEMDLILQAFAQSHLADMSDADLTLYETMLNESDHDLYLWVSSQSEPPAEYAHLIGDIRAQLSRQNAGQTG